MMYPLILYLFLKLIAMKKGHDHSKYFESNTFFSIFFDTI